MSHGPMKTKPQSASRRPAWSSRRPAAEPRVGTASDPVDLGHGSLQVGSIREWWPPRAGGPEGA